jgi:Putative phage serine protease XkdF
MSTMRELLATDETFREVADLLFGGGADELIAKMNPAQSDLATKQKKRERTEARIGLATNVVGIGAGAAATPPALKAVGAKYREAKGLPPKAKFEPRHKGGKLTKLKGLAGGKKAALTLAGGAAGLQVANLGGDFVANRVLARSAKKPVQKDLGDILNNSKDIPSSKGKLTLAAVSNPKVQKKGIEYSKKGAGALKKLPDRIKTTHEVEKSAGAPADTEIDVVWEGEFAKADPDKQQIFGWASVVEVNGESVVDLQGDRISPDEMEKAGYEYVMKSRKGGDMHLRDDWQPVQKSEMIESFIVTPEKRDAMGLPDSVPSGWWVGFQVRDPDVWAKVKSGERTGFSIHGHGRRAPLDS